MSSTNKTTNYELSQFLGTDKPAWLSDYNTDMNKIDTQMKANADAATSASGTASAASTAIGTLANLTTDVKTDLVSAINEVDSHADTAQGSADAVGVIANSNAEKITTIQNYFKFTDFNTTTATASGASIAANEIKYASNANGTLGKIYGRIVITTTATSPTITFNTPFRPESTINVDGICTVFNVTANVQNIVPMTIATNGTVTIPLTNVGPNMTIRLLFPACVIFLEDFGD